MKHELWLEGENEQMFCLAGQRGDSARRLLGDDARLVWSCEAESHFAAMTQYYRYMGWGEYRSDFPEQDKQTYRERGWE